MSPHPPPDLAASLTAALAEIARLNVRMERLVAENAELKRRLGMNSGNSSTPPSKDPIGAKAKRRADRSSRVRSKDKRPGGQAGHQGSGLEPSKNPDRTEEAEPPAECRGCGTDLAGSGDGPWGWAQIWDIPSVALEKVHHRLPSRVCECCGKITTATPSWGQAGAVSYGPNVNAAAILLGSEGNVPVERTAHLLEMMLGAPVSSGFVAGAQERLAGHLERGGFEEAMKSALRAEKVLCGDESPVNVLRRDADEQGRPIPGAAHVAVLRTPDARLIWYKGMASRSSLSIASLGVLADWPGSLVRDDYAGWHQFDADLAGVQQCCAHLIRHCKGVLEIDARKQRWAGDVIEVLREAAAAVTIAKAVGHEHLDPEMLADLRQRYGQAVERGITSNRRRHWHNGNHPGYKLANRLKDKAEQVWLFASNLAVPWTNNPSEQALRSPKRHQAVSGYWHTSATLARYLRIRSYLISAAGHGIRAITAIHLALTGNPWLPSPIT